MLLSAVAASAALLLRGACATRERAAEPPAEVGPRTKARPDPAPSARGPRVPSGRARTLRDPAPAPTSTPAAPSSASCAPRARKGCHQGDVWWFDGCERPEALVEACQGRPCAGIACQPEHKVAGACGAISAYGVCEGDVARACVGGRIESFDCAEGGERCAMTREGARCLPRHGAGDCAAGTPARCEGDRLQACVDGSWQEFDCGLRRAACESDADGARCGWSEAVNAGFGPLPLPKLEVCDALDNDDDTKIDEDGACDPIALAAFVPAGRLTREFEARLAQELAIVNRIFQPTEFAWRKRIEVPAELRSIEAGKLGQLSLRLAQIEAAADLADAARIAAAPAANADPAPPVPAFTIPVLFVDAIRGRPPKAGLSTLPNNRCGGVRVSDAPALPGGLIVVSASRQPETLAHELGHYLGLCHTHEELKAQAFALDASARCEREGDGICDTPPDPGPPSCSNDPYCAVSCATAEGPPDVFNVMSYYFGCRRALSAQQLAEANRNLSLRRGWARCLDPQDCPCLPGAADACPAEMSCQPGAAGWYCNLDGPGVPGALCRDSSQCSQNAFCLGIDGSARCVRPCQSRPSAPCTCIDVGLGFGVCSEDL